MGLCELMWTLIKMGIDLFGPGPKVDGLRVS